MWWVRLLLPVWVERVWLVVLSGLVLLALSSFQSQADRQREGRRIAIEVLCGAQQGVIDAGRDQLLSFGQRRAARRYAVLVARGIEREAGIGGLVNVKTGRLDCRKLVRSSAAVPAR